jgi:hypothetical protein
VPEVIARRTLEASQHELHRAGAEKFFAAGESWYAMMMQAALENQRLLMSFWYPWLSPRTSPASAMLGVLGAGLAPVHRRATSNVKRLRRRRTR